MIRLTRYRDKKPVYVFPEAIISAEIVDDATMINARSDRIFVTESPEEVARKVLEWRLAMIDYNDENTEIKAMAMKELVKLAGLEEPNHD